MLIVCLFVGGELIMLMRLLVVLICLSSVFSFVCSLGKQFDLREFILCEVQHPHRADYSINMNKRTF